MLELGPVPDLNPHPFLRRWSVAFVSRSQPAAPPSKQSLLAQNSGDGREAGQGDQEGRTEGL